MKIKKISFYLAFIVGIGILPGLSDATRPTEAECETLKQAWEAALASKQSLSEKLAQVNKGHPLNKPAQKLLQNKYNQACIQENKAYLAVRYEGCSSLSGFENFAPLK